MGNYSGQNLISTLHTGLGAACSILAVILFILSTPLFIYRQVVISLVKKYRPDLRDIVNGQSAFLLADYMAETAPRANIVVPLHFDGHLTCDEVKQRVMSNWFGAKSLEYKKFQQYPVRWLGFAFWKDASSTFSVDNHVHKYSGMETTVTDEKLTELVEVLLNERLPRNQSPWKLYVIENFARPDVNGKLQNSENSVLVMKWHHCLCDGFGIVEAFVCGLCQQNWKKVLPVFPANTSILHKIVRTLTFPAAAFVELSSLLSQAFRSSPFKISDDRKHWHQVVVKSGPVPIRLIKDIKNHFSVGFSSVMLSAFSAAIHKTLLTMDELSSDCHVGKSMSCLSVLPAVGMKKKRTTILTNHLTAISFGLPTTKYDSPVERLIAVNAALTNTKLSMLPVLAEWFTSIVGAYPQRICGWISKNRMVPIGLTNFAVSSELIPWDSTRKCFRSECIVGGIDGDAGIALTTISHGEEIGIFMAAEEALMTSEEAQVFMRHLLKEIDALRRLISKEKAC